MADFQFSGSPDIAITGAPNFAPPMQIRKYACTVVSLLPFEISEYKPHILPSNFVVPAAPKNGIAVLHVEEGVHWLPDPILDRTLKQVTSPDEMARSICEDYNSAQIGLGEGAEPGLFWVQGRLTPDEVMQYHAGKVKSAKARQTNWFKGLVALADADWNKNRNMLAVSDLQRTAAIELNITKDWVSFVQEEMKRCPSCGNIVTMEAVICPTCGFIVQKDRYKPEDYVTR